MNNRDENLKTVVDALDDLFDPTTPIDDAIYDRISWSAETATVLYDRKREI